VVRACPRRRMSIGWVVWPFCARGGWEIRELDSMVAGCDISYYSGVA